MSKQSKSKELSLWLTISAVVIGVVVALSYAASVPQELKHRNANDPPTPEEIEEQQQYTNAHPLEVVSFSPSYDTITGRIKNIGNQDLRYAEVSFGLYDNNHVKKGVAMTNITSLKAGESWDFKAYFNEDGVTQVELASTDFSSE